MFFDKKLLEYQSSDRFFTFAHDTKSKQVLKKLKKVKELRETANCVV